MSSEFEITILASGSKGNAAVIRAGEQAFLVDVGHQLPPADGTSASGRHEA